MRILLSFVTLVFMAQLLCAQNYPTPQISVSTEKIKENGVLKYVHHVKQGETLYALSKAYGVTSEEIVKQNPNLKSGLRSGMIVFIPEVTSQPPVNAKNYRKHTAKWYETLDDIAQSYRVPVADLMALNQLKSKELSRRQVLLIPDKQPAPSESESGQVTATAQITEKDLQTTTALVSGTTEERSPATETQQISFPDRPVRHSGNYETAEFSMILPLNGRDSAALNYNFMDFYAGALLAMNKLKEEGISLKINLFDQSVTSIGNIISSGELRNSQLIIGPVREYDVKALLTYSQNAGIPVVSPMDQSVEQSLSGNPYLLQVPSLSYIQTENLLAQLYRDYQNCAQGASVLVCYERDGMDTNAVRITKEYLDAHHIPYQTISYGILEGRGMLGRIKGALNYGTSNLVVVPSNSEAFVNDLVRNLNLCLSQDKESNPAYISPKQLIHLYGLPKWKNFETIEPEHFHKMNLSLSLPYHIDYNNEEVKEFLLKFRALYKTEPSPYAYQGYDIIRYFIPQLCKYGKEFINTLQLENGKMLQSDYSFSRKTSSDGLGNQATRTIKYNPDFSITTL